MPYKMYPTREHRVRIFFGVSRGELTRSKLKAHSYEEAGITRPSGTLFREDGLIGKASPS